MPLHTISGRLASARQSVKIGLIRLIFVTTNVGINGLTNVITANNSSFISLCKIDGQLFIFMQDSAHVHTVFERN